MSLERLGWNARIEAEFESYRSQGLEPARVAREERGRYLILSSTGEHGAEVSGRFRHDARSRGEFPAVGDWVAVRAPDDGAATIHAVLPRVSVFKRNVADEVTEEQVVAANVDVVLIVMGLDVDYNLRRLERYVAAGWDSGAQPVVVLNKADLVPDLEDRIVEVQGVAPGIPIVAMSARDGSGVDALGEWLTPGRTVALLGSSGVGKSTLVNALVGEERQLTREVRESDSRGRHTTTWRELIPTDQGYVLIDTPGMRLLKLWGDESDLGSAFPEIESLAAQCKFRDCHHEQEPGCAVLAAEASGGLDHDRLQSWRKLQRELRWLAIRQDKRLAAAEQAKWRSVHNAQRHHPKYVKRKSGT